MVDVRALPIPETFACDSCRSTWEHQLRNVDGGVRPATTVQDWRARWLTALRAPADVVAKAEERHHRDRDPYRGR